MASMLFSPNAPSLTSFSRGLTPTSFSRGLTPTPTSQRQPQVEVLWEPSSVRSELRQATQVLSQRCLKLAARWAAEQLVGVPEDVDEFGGDGSQDENKNDDSIDYERNTNTNTESRNLFASHQQPHLTDREHYARSLLELGEYLHAASSLSLKPKSNSVVTMPGPRKDLTPFGRYLRAYSLFMGGERRKEQDHLEQNSGTPNQKCGCNPYLKQLCQELSESYTNNQLDTFGYYVYGFILKEAQKEKLPLPHKPHTILIEHLLEFPWNWSAWLDFSEVIANNKILEQETEQTLQNTLASHYMYHFFCAHYMSNHLQEYERALILYERLFVPIHEPQPMPLFQSAYIRSQLGTIHYHLRDFEASLDCFEQVDDPYRLEDKDKYSNILYVKNDRVGLSNLAHQAVVVDKYRPETCCIIANYYSARQQREKAVLYFQRALKLDRTFTSAWTLMGHEYMELKQPERAMEAYRRAVEVGPADYRAWYGLGQTYELLNMPLFALYYFNKSALLRPNDARMWCAIGQCFLSLHRTADAIRAYEKAMARNDTDGIAARKLAELYRNDGKTEEAAGCYLRHLETKFLETNPPPSELQPNNTTSQWPTIDDIVQGVIVEQLEAEALLFLADYHLTHGENDSAALFCSRLVEYPGNERELAKSMLRDIRERSKRGNARPSPAASLRPSSNRRSIGASSLDPFDSTDEDGNDSSMDNDSSHAGNDRSRMFEFSP